MLSDIYANWPPNRINSVTNYKTTVRYNFPFAFSRSLDDLEDSAWWTGLRINVHSNQQLRFKVTLYCSLEVIKEWVQEADEWVPLPWPIPAKAGKILNFVITITIESGRDLNPVDVSILYSYQDMPNIRPKEQYLFVTTAGDIKYYWNDAQKEGGSSRFHEYISTHPARITHPVWNTRHIIVPPMEYLISTHDWENCCVAPISWDDNVFN